MAGKVQEEEWFENAACVIGCGMGGAVAEVEKAAIALLDAGGTATPSSSRLHKISPFLVPRLLPNTVRFVGPLARFVFPPINKNMPH